MVELPEKSIAKLTNWLAESKRAVFFGGAGVSTESGIPDFRSAAGLYAKKTAGGRSPEYLLSHECLVDDPKAFFAFHRAELVHPEAKPNPAHLALAHFEQAGHLAAVITQNIDELHQQAGSKTVYELHGSIYRNHCLGRAHHRYDFSELDETQPIPLCPQCGAMVRPDVVLYGEGLDMATIEASVDALANADMVIVGGTSLNVYPAAGLLNYYRGDRLVLINLERTSYDSQADLVIQAPIGQVLAEVERRLFGQPA